MDVLSEKMESEVLKPGKKSDYFNENSIFSIFPPQGTKIKPQIEDVKVKELLDRLYGIRALNVCELNSYDDRNFLITADKWVLWISLIFHRFSSRFL